MNSRTASAWSRKRFKLEGDRLFGWPLPLCALNRFWIELLAIAHDSMVKRAEGGDIVGTEHRLLLPGRLT